jgi:hypothetical protein
VAQDSVATVRNGEAAFASHFKLLWIALRPHFRGVVILLGGSLRAVAYAATIMSSVISCGAHKYKA